MKILFCFSSIPVGGLEVFTLSLAGKLSKKGVDVGILVFKSHDKGLDLVRNNEIRVFLAERKCKFSPSFLLNLYRVMKTFNPDIIVSLSGFVYFFVELTKRLYRIHLPHFIIFHSGRPLSLKGCLLTNLFMFLSKLLKAYYIFVSNSQCQEYQQYYNLPKERSAIVHNATDINFFAPCNAEKKYPFTIIHIANIWLEKDQTTLLKSLELLNKETEEWRLLFVGEKKDDLLDDFKAYLQSEHLSEKVTFIDCTDRKKIKDLLLESDVFILTSAREILPVAAIEALASGLPCILTNVGGCSEIVKDGYNGYLVESKDCDAIANKLLCLYKNPHLLAEMGRNARKTAEEKFDLDKCAEEYMRVFSTMNDRRED